MCDSLFPSTFSCKFRLDWNIGGAPLKPILAHRDKHLLAFSLSSAMLCLDLCYWPRQTCVEEDFAARGCDSQRAEAVWTQVPVWGSPARGWRACVNPDHSGDLSGSERTQFLSISCPNRICHDRFLSHTKDMLSGLCCLCFSSIWVAGSFCLPAGSAVCDTLQEEIFIQPAFLPDEVICNGCWTVFDLCYFPPLLMSPD